jgi:uncharacterized YigZ family protein
MLFDDTYRTVKEPAEALFTDRGSKFLGLACPIQSEHEIKVLLTEVKLKHPKAAHHCWAMRLTPDRSIFKVNDDGEPSGTAGRPILNMLLSKDVTNTLLIVVRYFGGTLLGVPGLINAYKTTAERALSSASIIEKTLNDVYTIKFDYTQMNGIMKLVKDEQLKIFSQSFDNESSLQLSIRKSQVNYILQKLNSLNLVKVEYNYSS